MRIGFDAFMLTISLIACALSFIRCDLLAWGVNAVSAGIWIALLASDMKEAKR